mmetsp:Transcript_68375/g.209692  ORF Transcript_68375/g.209692 Transcript_68375/m.209692 type:complete len:203 (-) Transcript_68375:235-843(-)
MCKYPNMPQVGRSVLAATVSQSGSSCLKDMSPLQALANKFHRLWSKLSVEPGGSTGKDSTVSLMSLNACPATGTDSRSKKPANGTRTRRRCKDGDATLHATHDSTGSGSRPQRSSTVLHVRAPSVPTKPTVKPSGVYADTCNVVFNWPGKKGIWNSYRTETNDAASGNIWDCFKYASFWDRYGVIRSCCKRGTKENPGISIS